MSEDQIVKLALEHSPDDRAAYLEDACGDDDAMRQRVEAMLFSHDDTYRVGEAVDPDETPSPMSPPTIVDADAATKIGVPEHEPTLFNETATNLWGEEFSEGPGTCIGPYKILRQLGEGGFGTVFMAEQSEPVRRRVALKVIKPGMDSREVIMRFDIERQALAMMDHVNVAGVLDGGATKNGRPYFVMPLVEGERITKYCDTHQLSLNERLELFMQVCDGIQHAHQKGVIHRDIKPSNVLVADQDGRPVPKVIDFGIAKAIDQRLTENSMVTQLGQAIGTPSYMSPEQTDTSGLDIDTRSDVYALGVMLYELLTGTTPLDRKQLGDVTLHEKLRRIREDDAPKPSTRLSSAGEEISSISAQRRIEPKKLTATVRGELDWIVMKALEKDRTRRYESASALAADLRRYLNQEPVEAGPPSTRYRLSKFAKKHRRMIVGAFAFTLILITGTAISVWQAVRAAQAEKDAVQAKEEERDARLREQGLKKESLAYLTKARKAADEWLIGLSGDLLYYPGLKPTRERLLREAEEHYESFSGRKSDDPTLMLEYGRSAIRLGDVQRLLQRHADAKSAYASAAETFEQLQKQIPDERDVQLELANARIGQALVLAESADTRKEAEHTYLSALEGIDRLLAAAPNNPEYRNARGRCVLALSVLLAELGQGERREKLIGEAIDIFEQLAREDDDPKYRSRVIDAKLQKAAALQDGNRHQEAARVLQEAIGTYDRIIQDNRNRPDLVSGRGFCRLLLSDVLRELARHEEAVQVHDAAIADYEFAVSLITSGLDAQNYQKIIGQEYGRLAAFSNRLGLNTDAKILSIKAVEIFVHLVNAKPNDPELVLLKSQSQTRLAVVLGELGEDKLAEGHFREALGEFYKLREFDPDQLSYREQMAVCLSAYARLLQRLQRTSDAQGYYEAAINHLEAVAKSAPENDSCRHELALCCTYLGDVYWAAGEAERATLLYKRAIKLRELLTADPSSNFELALLLANAVDTPVHNPQRAVALAQKLLESQPQEASFLNLLGLSHYRAGEWDKAIDALKQAITARSIDDSSDGFYGAMAFHQLREKEEAREAFEFALGVMAKQRPGNLRRIRLRDEAAQLLGISLPPRQPTDDADRE